MPAPQIPSSARFTLRRSLGSPALFAIVWTSLASALYFSLGVVSSHALSLTPVVFLAAGLFFSLTLMTYVEGASLHQDRAGSTVFARYAFNELVSFIAGWAILLDYVILVAVCALTATSYMATFHAPLGHGVERVLVTLGIMAFVFSSNVRGLSTRRTRRILAIVIIDLAIQLFVIVVGLILFFDLHAISAGVRLGTTPKWSDLIFALTITSVAFTSLESASGLSGEVGVGRAGLRRMVASANASIYIVYVGIGLVAVMAVRITGGVSPLAVHHLGAPVIGVVERFHPALLRDGSKYVVAAAATVTLIAAANSAMLGLSRLAYSLATNRQIPSALGRLHPQRSTPYVLIAIASALAAGLALANDLDFLVGIFAFGAMLAFTIAHLSICVLRLREPDRPRPYRMPFSVPIGEAQLPLPALLGALVSFAAWISVIAFHAGARIVGPIWMGGGLILYVGYRLGQDKPLLARVTVPEGVLRVEPPPQDYGSILVPLLGTGLDEDIVHTAALLVAGEQVDEAAVDMATIEAVWVFAIPMSLPLDARLPEEQLTRARAALARAKRVGEEYAGVEVATATVRARRVGQAIVEEARRRGVEAIVLAAEETPRTRGGALLGGIGVGESAVGAVTSYVVAKADCRVIVTALPPRDDSAAPRTRAGAASATA